MPHRNRVYGTIPSNPVHTGWASAMISLPPPPPNNHRYTLPGVLRAGASTVDFESEDIYLDIGPAMAVIKREAMVKDKALPKDVKQWNAADVLVYLDKNGLENFKPVLYRNGVVGKTLLKLRANMFPKGKFSEDELEGFDNALMRLRLENM